MGGDMKMGLVGDEQATAEYAKAAATDEKTMDDAEYYKELNQRLLTEIAVLNAEVRLLREWKDSMIGFVKSIRGCQFK